MDLKDDIQPAQSDQTALEATDTSQTPPQPVMVASPTNIEKPQLSRSRRFIRRLLIGLVVIGMIFLAGLVSDHYLRYEPLSESFHKTQASLEQANQNMSELQAQTGQLNILLQEANDKVISLNREKKTLQDELEMATQHLELLRVLVDVSNARLALALNDTEGAKAALVDTRQGLDNFLPRIAEIDPLLAKSMPQRLSLIVSGLERDTETAIIDLGLFANDLLEIEAVMSGS